ncbi:hypothetical protein C0Q70_11872 [Pomacea canaliculata]|uniref:Uncharacterized protein n=1 Tax=Pomacea canaliculata TaxID=400727 RepID=A0A2T7P770_POMCA|nr:hypothetical protein C0Q70_11872 [Pomacea canaliculata]
MKSLSAGRLKDDKGSLQLAGYRVIEAPSVTGDTWRPATSGGRGGGGLLLLVLVTTDEQRVSASVSATRLTSSPGLVSVLSLSVCVRSCAEEGRIAEVVKKAVARLSSVRRLVCSARLTVRRVALVDKATASARALSVANINRRRSLSLHHRAPSSQHRHRRHRCCSSSLISRR